MDDICLLILQLLPIKNMYICSQVNKSFNKSFNNNILWKDIFLLKFINHECLTNKYITMYKIYHSFYKHQPHYPLNKQITKYNINCSGYWCNTVTTEICEIKTLVTIDLSFNKITIIPTEIGTLTNLTELKFNGNNIINIPTEIGNLTNLTLLNLSNNNISYIPTEIGNMQKLKTLNFHGNKISIIPDEICNANNLTKINLHDNPIDYIPNHLSRFKLLF